MGIAKQHFNLAKGVVDERIEAALEDMANGMSGENIWKSGLSDGKSPNLAQNTRYAKEGSYDLQQARKAQNNKDKAKGKSFADMLIIANQEVAYWQGEVDRLQEEIDRHNREIARIDGEIEALEAELRALYGEDWKAKALRGEIDANDPTLQAYRDKEQEKTGHVDQRTQREIEQDEARGNLQSARNVRQRIQEQERLVGENDGLNEKRDAALSAGLDAAEEAINLDVALPGANADLMAQLQQLTNLRNSQSKELQETGQDTKIVEPQASDEMSTQLQQLAQLHNAMSAEEQVEGVMRTHGAIQGEPDDQTRMQLEQELAKQLETLSLDAREVVSQTEVTQPDGKTTNSPTITAQAELVQTATNSAESSPLPPTPVV